MAKINLSFAFKNGNFCLCATVAGTQKRHYRLVEGLNHPQFARWDRTLQMFSTRAKNGVENNIRLAKIKAHYEQILSEHEFNSGKELFDYDKEHSNNAMQEVVKTICKQQSINMSSTRDAELVKILVTYIRDNNLVNAPNTTNTINTPTVINPVANFSTAQVEQFTAPTHPTPVNVQPAVVPNKCITYGEYLDQVIEKKKNSIGKKPSLTYLRYCTLKNKLLTEGNLINIPLNIVATRDLNALSEWLVANGASSSNYTVLMKYAMAVLHSAVKIGIITSSPTFSIAENTPVNKEDENEDNFKSLSVEQYEQFCSIEVMGLFHNQWSSKKFEYIMFRDFCILLYELKSRPIDIVTMKWSSIEYNERYGGYVCSYVPTKKKNTTNRNKAKSVQFISSKAMEIMQKYKGQSKYGYILPFEINNTREWDLNDVEQFHEHSKMWKVLQNMMGRFLERVGKKLGLPFKLTLYAFRRTAITHEIINNEMPINMIAKVAGTSTRMIESHYTNYLDALSHFRTQEQLDMAAEDVDKNNNKNPRKPKKSKRG